MNEIIAIAGSTWKNVLRLKVVYFLVFCVWVLVTSALNYDVLSLGLHKELLVDASLLLNTIAGVLVIISLTFEIPKELKEGVASTMLSKPLGRTHYLIGKLVGYVVVGVIVCSLIALGSFFIFKISFSEPIGMIMLQSQIMVILSLIPMAALAVLFSIALPEIVAPIVTVLVVWFAHSSAALFNIPVVYGGIIPDLDLFNFKADAVYNTAITWNYVILVALWGIAYALFATALASLIFSRKDIR
jgi:ABC-type transport system involved in multi-copper enzyme maturation permease subunit